MVHAVKEFPYVAFEDKAFACPVFCDRTNFPLQNIHTLMSAKSNSARKRLGINVSSKIGLMTEKMA